MHRFDAQVIATDLLKGPNLGRRRNGLLDTVARTGAAVAHIGAVKMGQDRSTIVETDTKVSPARTTCLSSLNHPHLLGHSQVRERLHLSTRSHAPCRFTAEDLI